MGLSTALLAIVWYVLLPRSWRALASVDVRGLVRTFGGLRIPLLDDPRRAVRVSSRLAYAVGCAVVALVVGRLLEPAVLRPYFFPAAIAFVATALAAGTRYGIITSAVFAAGHAIVHLPPRGSFALRDPRELIAVIGFFVTGSLVSMLGGALRAAYARLQEQNQLLRDAQAQREDLLRALAHDIRTPLTVLTTNTILLLSRLEQLDAASVRGRLETIRTSANAIEAMLRDLTEVATVESGHVRLERAPTNLAAFVSEVVQRLAATLPIERVKVAIPAELTEVPIDRERFERVIVNLLTNAVKYSPAGTFVTIGGIREARSVVLSIEDEGPGIAPEDLPHVFDKYYRSSQTRPETGLGLGLFIARLFVEAHGGTIWVESTRGTGTSFNIAIPLSDREGPRAA